MNYATEYPYGSRVYGTHGPNSDYDIIRVLSPGEMKMDTLIMEGDRHYQVYTHEEWLFKIRNHDISALECIFLPAEKIDAGDIDYSQLFKLDLHRLRESISTISNNSWVKGKKKLIVSGDYDKKAALKSVFHSIRILRFGIQVARQGKITNYEECNWLWYELEKLGSQYDSDILWNKINEKYKTLFNATSSEFKLVAPKDLIPRDKVRTLKDILEKHGCYSPELADEIKELYD